MNAYHFGLNGEYKFKNNLVVSGKYGYLDVSDNNSGNLFVERLGKVFESDLTACYEYYFYSLKDEKICCLDNHENTNLDKTYFATTKGIFYCFIMLSW